MWLQRREVDKHHLRFLACTMDTMVLVVLCVFLWCWLAFNQESAPKLSCVQVDLFGRLSHQSLERQLWLYFSLEVVVSILQTDCTINRSIQKFIGMVHCFLKASSLMAAALLWIVIQQALVVRELLLDGLQYCKFFCIVLLYLYQGVFKLSFSAQHCWVTESEE